MKLNTYFLIAHLKAELAWINNAEMGLKKLNLSLEAYNADTHISPKGKSLKMQKVRPS